MGVYIKNMEMPMGGRILIVFPSGRTLEVSADSTQNILREAKAVPVPEHGRLGDLDKLEQMFVDIDNAPYSGFDGSEPFYSAEDAAQIIRLSPTIIPASEEGET